MKESGEGVGRKDTGELGRQAGEVIEGQVRKWQEVVVHWAEWGDVETGNCGDMVVKCKKVTEEVAYLEACVPPT